MRDGRPRAHTGSFDAEPADVVVTDLFWARSLRWQSVCSALGMRRRRRSWLLAVHRWLFHLSWIVVLASALSHIDDGDRLPDHHVFAGADQTGAVGDPRADNDPARHKHDELDESGDVPPLFAFAACP
jgi:hypothetical protein